MKNNLQRHERRDSVKWFMVLLAVILLAVSVMAAITQGFRDWNPYGWLDKEGQPETPSGGAPVMDENGNELDGDTVHAMPARMTFRSAAALDGESSAYDSVTLTATVKPDDAMDKKVDWSVVFVNPTSTWATGKNVTDYMTVAAKSDGSTTATVQCLQPFGEKINVVVTSRANPNAKAECAVDFITRVLSVDKLTWTSAGNGDTASSSRITAFTSAEQSAFTSMKQPIVEKTLSDGTMQEDFSLTIKVFWNKLAVNSWRGSGFYVLEDEIAVTTGFYPDKKFFFKLFGDKDPLLHEKNSVLSWSKNVTLLTFSVLVGGEHSSASNTFSFFVDFPDFQVVPTEISLNETNVII